jgi:CHASE2 domain-containing sensor protein
MSRRKKKKPEKLKPRPAPAKADCAVHPRLYKWRWPLMCIMLFSVSLMVLFAWWIGLFNILDNKVNNLLATYVGTTMEQKFDKDLVVIKVDHAQTNGLIWGKSDASHRSKHTELLDILATYGAKVVVFDMSFENNADREEVDECFAKAIEDAKAQGVQVLVGAAFLNGQPLISSWLKSALKDSVVSAEGGRYKTTEPVKFVSLGTALPPETEDTVEQRVVPSLALEVLKRFSYSNPNVHTLFNPYSSTVILRAGGPGGRVVNQFPVKFPAHGVGDLQFLVDFAPQTDETLLKYQDVILQRGNPTYEVQIRDKVVIVGYEDGDTHAIRDSSGDERTGAEIHANAISNLLQDSFTRPVSFSSFFMVMSGMLLLGTVLRLRCGHLLVYTLPIAPLKFIDWKPKVPTILLIASALYIAGAILAYRVQRTVFNISYDIAALFLAYFIASLVCPRLGFR